MNDYHIRNYFSEAKIMKFQANKPGQHEHLFIPSSLYDILTNAQNC